MPALKEAGLAAVDDEGAADGEPAEAYSATCEQPNEERASEQVMDAVARTFGAVVTSGVLNGYFPDGHPFGAGGTFAGRRSRGAGDRRQAEPRAPGEADRHQQDPAGRDLQRPQPPADRQ